MIKFLMKFYSDLKVDYKVYADLKRRCPKTIYFSNLVFTWVVVATLSGIAFFEGYKTGFETLSKTPRKSVIKLIINKCQDSIKDENYNKDTKYKRFASCMDEEFSHIRDQAVNVTLSSKFSIDVDECVTRTKNIEKCLINIEHLNTKRRDAYKSFKALMEINGMVE